MRPVASLVKRGCLSVLALVVCLIVMVVSAGKYAANRHSFPENTASWGQSGNYSGHKSKSDVLVVVFVVWVLVLGWLGCFT